MHETKISGQLVDVVARSIRPAIVTISGTKISSIDYVSDAPEQFLIPGFVDAHIHIESSMMLPSEFARQSLKYGTVACVCDPHEIANVCGIEGINYMIEDGKKSPMKFFFGAPSCVPSTSFDSAGATINSKDITSLMQRDDIHFLAEMMNYVGVVHRNKEVLAKLEAAKLNNKPIDGHAPELNEQDLTKYVESGISTDHECMTLADAKAKIALGMKIQIREGSAAKNFDSLLPLIKNHADKLMFCSDDKHPDDLIKYGHINSLATRAVAAGNDTFDVLRICSMNPILHYNLNVGLLQIDDDADFLVVENLKNFKLKINYINGIPVFENNQTTFERQITQKIINKFEANPIQEKDIAVEVTGTVLKVIVVEDGQLMTKCEKLKPKMENGKVVTDLERDILKIVVYNRYNKSTPAVGFIKNFGLKTGAMASTVAHDSHNIVAVGTSDSEIVFAINEIIKRKGAVLTCDKGKIHSLDLPIAGLMSDKDGVEIANEYVTVDKVVKSMGSKLKAPFMTLAFMSLVVIPEIKLGDKGLFDTQSFTYTNLMD
jgi:adenine deaminase